MSRPLVFYAAHVARQQPGTERPSARERSRRAAPEPATPPEPRVRRFIAARLSFAAPLVARLSHRP
jgi:hypothetical protein